MRIHTPHNATRETIIEEIAELCSLEFLNADLFDDSFADYALNSPTFAVTGQTNIYKTRNETVYFDAEQYAIDNNGRYIHAR